MAFFLEKGGHVEFFDSFGRNPSFYNEAFERFMNVHGKKSRIYNNLQVQSSGAKTCGAHVIFYLISRCSGKKLMDVYPKLIPPPYHDLTVKRYLLTLSWK